ncbi:MAG TPA: DUF72 domain-containing protein [Deltaproteobacteria bacterium]|nr:DUF72 domain-containing protein [Deltaproteobacteria bacterium]
MRYFIGTSGWQYFHWTGIFYPPHIKSKEWLSFYSQFFNTVETNVTFYRNIRPSTCRKWFETVPSDFLFSVKMSRFITHIKRLRIDEHSIKLFNNSMEPLNHKLGVILIQLPPGLIFDKPLMNDFLSLLDKRYRYTIEARNKTFIDDDLFSLLTELNIAWCIADSAGRFPYHEATTADFVYIRLHGKEKLYASSYRDDELKIWINKIRAWDRDAFVYFDNDFMGYAVRNALSLKQLFDKVYT